MSVQAEDATDPAARTPTPTPDRKHEDETIEVSLASVAKQRAAEAAHIDFTGTRLRDIREARGLSINELSERTRISRTILLALEDERYEEMPNARVYVRGFVRCVARELELDMDEVSDSYVPRWERWFDAQQ